MPISFTTAALGGEIEIPTLDGAAKLKIPAETQSGKVFRLRGKGIKGVRSHTHGDLLCHVVVETPVNLTDRQKELLRELDESLFRPGQQGGRRQRPQALALVALDDGYETERTVANTKTLINEKKCLRAARLYGSSPTTEAMNKVFGPAKVPLVGTISGAGTCVSRSAQTRTAATCSMSAPATPTKPKPSSISWSRSA
jgi:hypothetical protein